MPTVPTSPPRAVADREQGRRVTMRSKQSSAVAHVSPYPLSYHSYKPGENSLQYTNIDIVSIGNAMDQLYATIPRTARPAQAAVAARAASEDKEPCPLRSCVSEQFPPPLDYMKTVDRVLERVHSLKYRRWMTDKGAWRVVWKRGPLSSLLSLSFLPLLRGPVSAERGVREKDFIGRFGVSVAIREVPFAYTVGHVRVFIIPYHCIIFPL